MSDEPDDTPTPEPHWSEGPPVDGGASGQGWYADPTGRHERRLWDGLRWTDSVADGAQTSQDPVGIHPARTHRPVWQQLLLALLYVFLGLVVFVLIVFGACWAMFAWPR